MANLKNAKTVYTLPGPLYCAGAPLLIAGGELLETEALQYCRLRLQVLDDARVASVTVAVQALDKAGEALGLEQPYRFLTRAGRDDIIGEQEPILLALSGAVSFRVRVLCAAVNDGTWTADAPWTPLPAPKTLEEHYGEAELAEQFRIRYGSDCRYAITAADDLWFCTCGALNRKGENSCHRCHRVRAALENVRVDALQAESDSRARKAPLRLQQLKEDRRSLTKQLVLGAALVLPLLILVIGLLIAVPREIERKNLYEGAQWLAGIGEFDAARIRRPLQDINAI